jgi:hypothetical protein
VDGHPRQVWLGADGSELIEHFSIAGMAHGIPLMPGTGEGQSGQAGAHMLDVGLSSTDRIAAFFGIAPKPAERGRRSSASASPPRNRGAAKRVKPQAEPTGVQAVIENALKVAGLMR